MVEASLLALQENNDRERMLNAFDATQRTSSCATYSPSYKYHLRRAHVYRLLHGTINGRASQRLAARATRAFYGEGSAHELAPRALVAVGAREFPSSPFTAVNLHGSGPVCVAPPRNGTSRRHGRDRRYLSVPARLFRVRIYRMRPPPRARTCT